MGRIVTTSNNNCNLALLKFSKYAVLPKNMIDVTRNRKFINNKTSQFLNPINQIIDGTSVFLTDEIR